MVALENNQRLLEKVGLPETIGPFGLDTIDMLATEIHLRKGSRLLTCGALMLLFWTKQCSPSRLPSLRF